MRARRKREVADQATTPPIACRDDPPLIHGAAPFARHRPAAPWPGFSLDIREVFMSKQRRRFRTIWISDFHLATRGCQADYLLDFLRHHDADYLYLVGDIVDGWRIKKGWFWLQTHNDVIQKLLKKARHGTRIWLLPGNHDEALRDYIGIRLGGVSVVEDVIHTTADGRRLLVLHGDRFDGVVKHARWLALLGEGAYNAALLLNQWFNTARRKLGYPYWSLSSYLKRTVKKAVEFAANYQLALAAEAHRRGVDGVVCGHLHRAEIRDVDGILYCNDGDWVESCTALVEHFDGTLEIVHWTRDGKGNLDFSEPVRRKVDEDDPSLASHPSLVSFASLRSLAGLPPSAANPRPVP
jgi:UDP-2,3-diacylglucosamine pyrophosphatase LpxH